VQYVKSLGLQEEAMHGQLDLMQRRNSTLQKVALLKIDTNTLAIQMSIEETDEELPTATDKVTKA
jgi:hypothetical protein